jgi:hypothetical protein
LAQAAWTFVEKLSREPAFGEEMALPAARTW